MWRAEGIAIDKLPSASREHAEKGASLASAAATACIVTWLWTRCQASA